MREVLIRPTLPADLSAITEIYADAVWNGTATYEVASPDLAEISARFDALCGPGFPHLVAEHEGCVLGFAYASPFRARPAYRFLVEDSVYIAPDAKGQGVGHLLLQRLIGAAADLGFRQMVAVIGDSHPQSPSVKLHSRLGFVHAGRLPATGYKHGRWLDTGFMQLTLNERAEAPPDPNSLPERLFSGPDQLQLRIKDRQDAR